MTIEREVAIRALCPQSYLLMTLYKCTVCAMSTGFQPPAPPLPSYVIHDMYACRTCSRLVVKIVQEYPHPRMRLECKLGRHCPVQVCDDWEREVGAD